jgi:MATE family multidrug resistance protein
MAISIFSNASNILFNYLFIFGIGPFPELGIVGAGIGTVLSQYLQGTLLLLIFLGPSIHAKFQSRDAWHFDPVRIRELLRIGLPGGVNFFLEVANWGLFLSFIIGKFGDASLAATNIAISFMHLSFMPTVAISEATAPIVGRWIGKNDVPRAKARTWTALRIASVYMLCMGTTFAFFGEGLIRLFFTKDPEIILLGHRFLMLAAVFQGFDAFTIVCNGALRGAGDTRWMMFVNLLITYPFFLPLAWLMAVTLNGGATGAWIAATIYIILMSFVLFWRFWSERWRHIRIFAEDTSRKGDSTATIPSGDIAVK